MFQVRTMFLAPLKWAAIAITLVLNGFVYFYPDLVNSPGQCSWKDEHYVSRFPVINNLNQYWRDLVLLNFPLLQAPKAADENRIHLLTFGDPQINGNWPLTPYIKRLDNYGNDHYLGHIYRTMQARLRPSHVAVMGDQFLSQWIYDTEFYNRTLRFVERLFPQPDKYKQNVVETWARHEDYDWRRFLEDENAMDPDHRFNSRAYRDVYDWTNLSRHLPNFDMPMFINLTGNHDIGYSGDATWQHMARFHHLFGQNNYVVVYNEGQANEWRLVVLDALTLEGPALQDEFVRFTWQFLERLNLTNANFRGSTVLLTHIPFYKREGLCADGPEHKYYVDNDKEPYKNGLLRSQNHLLYETTQKVFDIVFPNADKEGIVLTGHDHVGCDDWYNYIDGEWVASKDRLEGERAPIREIVVRAMMGDFQGQTGIVTGRFDGSWKFDFHYCSFVVQHWWWASKVSALVALMLASADYIST